MRPHAVALSLLVTLFMSACSSSSTAPASKSYPPLVFPAHFAGVIVFSPLYSDTSLDHTGLKFVVDRADSLFSGRAIFEQTKDTVLLAGKGTPTGDPSYNFYRIKRWKVKDSVNAGWYDISIDSTALRMVDTNSPDYDNDYGVYAYRTD